MNIWIAIGIVIITLIAVIIPVFYALFKNIGKKPDDMDEISNEVLKEHEISEKNMSLGAIPLQKPKNGLKTLKFNYDLIDNIEFDDVDSEDYPDFVDAFIAGADYNGEEMTYYQLDRLNEDKDFVYEKLMEHLF